MPTFSFGSRKKSCFDLFFSCSCEGYNKNRYESGLCREKSKNEFFMGKNP